MAAVAAAWLVSALWTAEAGQAQPEIDCTRPAQGRELIARLRLAEIEGAEDIHRAAMWEAFGRCPEGAAGESCRAVERQRFERAWDHEKARIQARYRALLSEFEARCLGRLSRAAIRAVSGAAGPALPPHPGGR